MDTFHCRLAVREVLSFSVWESRSAGHQFPRAEDALKEEESDLPENEGLAVLMSSCGSFVRLFLFLVPGNQQTSTI